MKGSPIYFKYMTRTYVLISGHELWMITKEQHLATISPVMFFSRVAGSSLLKKLSSANASYKKKIALPNWEVRFEALRTFSNSLKLYLAFGRHLAKRGKCRWSKGLFVDRVFSIIIHLSCLLSYQHIKYIFLSDVPTVLKKP